MEVKIGTSGYAYSHWEGIFYPQNLPKSKKLEYYCSHFKTVELNNTFYRLPQKKVFESWYKRSPKDFIFALKVSRFITHIKKLKDCRESWKIFLERALGLKEKLGPLLFQLPPSFKNDPKRLKGFIEMLFKNSPPKIKFAFEFRNESWCQNETYQILKEKKCAWVIADSPRWPKKYEVTSNFVYVRMHGSKALFSSDYTKGELKELREWIQKWRKKELEVFVYFNNDAQGFAVKNAKELINLL